MRHRGTEAQRRKKIVKENRNIVKEKKEIHRYGGTVQRPGLLRPKRAGENLAGGGASNGAAGRSGTPGERVQDAQSERLGLRAELILLAIA